MSLLQMKSKIVYHYLLHILNRRMVSDGSKINSYVMHVCFRFYEKNVPEVIVTCHCYCLIQKRITISENLWLQQFKGNRVNLQEKLK